MNKYAWVVPVIMLFILGCNTNKSPVSPTPYYDFSIYLLQDTQLELHDIQNANLNNLVLQDTPLLNSDDIVMYDFSTHMIYLNKSKKEIFGDLMGDSPSFVEFITKPFVVVCGTERIYAGLLFSTISSIACQGPTIFDHEVFFLPEDLLPIHNCRLFDDPVDPRTDVRVQQALQSSNLYHAGIHVELQNVFVAENADTSTIVYQFNLTNNDKQTLMVPDPDKMGTNLFHYYTQGIHMRNENNQRYFYAEYNNSFLYKPDTAWDPSWFTELNSGESIERSVMLRGFPKLPAGTYRCEFYYGGPDKIEKEERTVQEKRYWIGNIYSNSISINIK